MKNLRINERIKEFDSKMSNLNLKPTRQNLLCLHREAIQLLEFERSFKMENENDQLQLEAQEEEKLRKSIQTFQRRRNKEA